MGARGAGGGGGAKVSVFRAVRNLEKACSLCEQAANKASRKAAVGASGAFATEVAVLLCAAELLSCATAIEAKSSSAGARATLSRRARRTTSVLCRLKNGRQILRKGGARQHFIATRSS